MASVVLGKHPADPKTAENLLKILKTDQTNLKRDIETLCKIPENRGERDESMAKDPVVRRFDELIDVYGDVFKHIIREEAGDGIMSAIDCKVDIEKVHQNGEDRIILKVDGKFLAYKH